MKSILDSSFQYTPSGATDIRKTFARVRSELWIQEKMPTDALAAREFAPGIELVTFTDGSPTCLTDAGVQQDEARAGKLADSFSA